MFCTCYVRLRTGNRGKGSNIVEITFTDIWIIKCNISNNTFTLLFPIFDSASRFWMTFFSLNAASCLLWRKEKFECSRRSNAIFVFWFLFLNYVLLLADLPQQLISNASSMSRYSFPLTFTTNFPISHVTFAASTVVWSKIIVAVRVGWALMDI